MNHRWFAAAAILLVLSGCGGSGGGSYNPPAPQITPGLQQALITRGNAVPLLDASFSLTGLSRSVMYDFPYLANYVLYYAENGQYFEESACDNQDGTTTISGDLSVSDGTGEILFTDEKCLVSQYGVQTDGVIRITIDRTDLVAFPIIYTVSFENFETTLTTGNYGTVTDGTIEVHSPSGAGQVAVVNLRITDIGSGAYIEAEELTIDSDVTVGDYPFAESTRIAGTVGHSDYGTMELSSGTSIMEYMELAGAQNTSMRIAFLDEELFIASLDDNGDGVPNAYMTATVSQLSENPGMNDAPVAEIGDAFAEERGSPIRISLLDVTDPDCDFLEYSVNLIESPPGSRFDWSIDGDYNLVINMDQTGQYLFNLIIDDGYNGILEKQISIHIFLQIPDVEIGQTLFRYETGDLVAIDVSPLNSEQGPFTYDFSPAIPGMSISNNGILTWQVPPSNSFFPQRYMQVELSVGNGDHTVSVPLTIIITDPDKPQPIVRTGVELPDKERSIHVGDFDNDGVTEILLTDNRNLIYTLEWDNGKFVQDWVYPYEISSPGDSVDAILPLDLEGNGKYMIYVQTGSQIKVLDINNSIITSILDFSQFVEENNVAAGCGMAAADIDNEGSMELVALFEGKYYDDLGTAFAMDAADLTLLWQTPVLDLGRGHRYRKYRQ